MFRSLLAGLIVGLLSFAASGSIIYSVLSLWQTVSLRKATNIGVVIGIVYGNLGVGLLSGLVIGIFATAFHHVPPSASEAT